MKPFKTFKTQLSLTGTVPWKALESQSTSTLPRVAYTEPTNNVTFITVLAALGEKAKVIERETNPCCLSRYLFQWWRKDTCRHVWTCVYVWDGPAAVTIIINVLTYCHNVPSWRGSSAQFAGTTANQIKWPITLVICHAERNQITCTRPDVTPR